MSVTRLLTSSPGRRRYDLAYGTSGIAAPGAGAKVAAEPLPSSLGRKSWHAGSALKSAPSAASSRSTSPANGNSSFIPQPGRGAPRASLNEKHAKTNGSVGRSSLRAPSSANNQTSHGGVASPYRASPSPQANNAKHKDSMLDKFKLFNHKDKDTRNKTKSKIANSDNTSVSKRTSSSSGFSSARSERSDSSTSLCSDIKPPPLPPHQSLPVSSSSSSSEQTHIDQQQEKFSVPSSKPQGLRGIRSKFTKSSGKEGKESPKTSRKDKEDSRSSPRSSHKTHRSGEQRGDRSESRDRTPRRGDKLTLDLNGSPKARSQQPLPADALHSKQRAAALVPRPDPSVHALQDRPPALPPKEASRETGIPPRLPANPPPAMPQYHHEKTGGSTPSSPLPPGTPGLGIPKPTALVKGQAKSVPTPVSPTYSPSVNNPSQNKDFYKMVHQSSSTQTQKGIPTSAGRAAGTPVGGEVQEILDPKGSLPRQKQLGKREQSSSSISVGIVSPMPNNRDKDQVTPSESGSNISESNSSHSNSGQSNSNSSGNSSVIYRPTSSEDESSTDLKTHIMKVIEKLEGEEGDEVIFNIKPMQPLVRASQYGYMRGLGQHSNRTVPPSLHVSRLALQENSNTVPQKGMRFSPHLKRPPGGPTDIISESDYSDLESIDLANGYMSDGDVLRSVGYKSGNSSDLDGYLSEGGASLYAHRLNQRFKEGMRQVHESMNRVQHFIQDDSRNGGLEEMETPQDNHSLLVDEVFQLVEEELYDDPLLLEMEIEEIEENNKQESFYTCNFPVFPVIDVPAARNRFDDSSSLSSGVSDNLNEMSAEDVLSSSFSDHQSITKAGRNMKEVGLKLPVGLSGSSRKVGVGADPSGMYKVVSSRAHVKKTESAQQTENSAFKQISNTQWKKYVENGKGSLERSARELQRGLEQQPGIITNSRKSDQKKTSLGSPLTGVPGINAGPGISSPLQASKKLEKKGLIADKRREDRSGRDKSIGSMSPHLNGDSKKIQSQKTVPTNFSYGTKKSASSGSVPITSTPKSHKGIKEEEATAVASHSLERPRTKLKVSGGTQTTSDLQYMPSGVHSDGEYSSGSLGRNYQLKSYSLNGPVAAQLSQSVRDRIMQSPYSKVHVGEYGQFATSPYYRERSPRKITDGSLSDSPYSNYAELQYAGSPYSSPYSWVARGSNYATSVASAPTRPVGGSLTEAESMESISSSASSSMAAQLQQARDSRLTQARLMMHQREMSSSPSPRLNRSNSVSHLIERTFPRSTKSEKLYNHNIMEGRQGYHMSQPTSPTPPGAPRLNMSPLNTAVRGSPYYSPGVAKATNEEECVGSQLSLVSSSSSLYSSQEEKQASEIRKLRRDLSGAQQKVGTLTNQLTTNAHVVAAFEQSLTNMTNRLQRLTASSEQKESEVYELRKTIEALRQQSIEAGLTVACLQSGNLVRGTSVESVSSLSSACSATSHASTHDKANKKKGWLRSSFSKAFSRGQKKSKGDLCSGSVSDMEGWERGEYSVPSSPMLQRAHSTGDAQQDSLSCAASDISQIEEKEHEVEELKQELQKKEMILTDIRLEALTSAHHLESLKETISKMRNEMLSLKNDNQRLQRIVISKSLNSSQSSIPTSIENADQRLSIGEDVSMPDPTEVILIDPKDKDGKRVSITVFMGCQGEYDKYICPVEDGSVSECVIGAISISGKTKWDMLDSLVKRIFKEYILRVDPVSNLGLSADSITSYHLGEIFRGRDSEPPELLPCGYLVGEVFNLRIVLKGASINQVDALAFETLTPKSIVQRYVSLLTEHRRIILCGPTGTGKTYLAHKLAEFLVSRLGKDPSPGNIATFNVDHKTGKDLGAYLSHISDQCENNASDMPMVIILDNLHHAGALTDVFNGFLSAKYTQCPYIIGTMNQTTSCSTTNLQLHHNFRWVLIANHMEPVKGLVGRIARRKLTQVEVENGTRLPRLQQILDWLPRCWAHINKFLETHSSSDVTIGPRLFLSCPGAVEGSQVWFTDLWNYSLVPYLVEAVREGLQLYGKRASWEDPSVWITETYPWPPGAHAGPTALLSLRSEDVGYDSLANTNTTIQEKPDSEKAGENDPLLNMLMRLQEAANYSTPQQESDTTSLENMDNAQESTI
ncbi:unnamed protein product, partial [Meganyctiphanes norvegica]